MAVSLLALLISNAAVRTGPRVGRGAVLTWSGAHATPGARARMSASAPPAAPAAALAPLPDGALELLLVLDVEATCDQPQRAAHEIIEWPVVLVDAATARPIAEFHRYVRPTEGPTLSAFCTKLTGIAQADVDGAQPLAVVLDEFDDWLRELGLLDPPAGAPRKRWALATDGPWDLNHFNARECARKGIAPRPHLRQYVNVRKAFARVHNMRSSRGVSLKAQLARLGLAFEGRPHCGRDDARNIARVLCALVQRRSRHALAINEASDAAVPGRYVSLKLDEAAAGTPGLGGVGFVRGPKKVRGKRNKARAAADEALLDARDANGACVPAAA